MTQKIFVLSAVIIWHRGLGVELKKIKREICGFVRIRD
jgi:hypothetical protein